MCLAGSSGAQDEPPLPMGLEPAPAATDAPAPDGPALPEGLEPTPVTEPTGEPTLPEGLGEESPKPEPAETGALPRALPEGLSGFFEVRTGLRTRDNRYQRDGSIGETRLQLEFEKLMQKSAFHLSADFIYDDVISRHRVHLDEGRGWLDLREANVSWTPMDFCDIKVGRQILTWGTGDLLFINDLFPKDWNSFFIGRDDEYLKAPSDAIKVSLFSELANLNVVYTPAFNPDRYIDGRRISYYNPVLGRSAGRDAEVRPLRPNEWFTDDEIATVAVPGIGDRLALLGSGELQAGMLPEPPTSLAQQGGAVVVIDDTTYPEVSFSTISFRKEIIDDHPEAIRGFLSALEEATRRINANPDQYSELLIEKKLVPPPLMGSFGVPQYPAAGVPSQEQWDDALAWTIENGLNDVQVSYHESVTDAYLP